MDYQTFIVSRSDSYRIQRIAETQVNYASILSEFEGDVPLMMTVLRENSAVICEKTADGTNRMKVSIFGIRPAWIQKG